MSPDCHISVEFTQNICFIYPSVTIFLYVCPSKASVAVFLVRYTKGNSGLTWRLFIAATSRVSYCGPSGSAPPAADLNLRSV